MMFSIDALEGAFIKRFSVEFFSLTSSGSVGWLDVSL